MDGFDDFMPDDYMLGKKESLDPILGPENQTGDVNGLPIQRRQENNTGKIPGIVLKGVFFAIVVALLPLIQKQSPQLMHYANHPSITRSWDLFHLLFVGLAISYGLIARRTGAVAEKEENDDLGVHGTQDYVQNMFEFASVFDDYDSGAGEVLIKNKAEAYSSRWRSEEPLHVIADNAKENGTEKPLLLPIRSLKHSLSNPQEFVYEAESAVPAAAQGDPKLWNSEVRRNGDFFSVDSGNFEAELSNIINYDEPAVFRSPIPWSSRREILNNKTPLSPAPVPAPAVNNLGSNDGKQKFSGQNPPGSILSEKQDYKLQVPPSRQPPPPPPPPPPPTVLERQPSDKDFPTRSVQKAAYHSPRSSPSPSVSPSPRSRPSPSPSPSPTPRQTLRPSPSPSPSPRQTPRPSPSPTRPRSVTEANRNSQASSGIPLHKFSSPRPSPSPTRSRPVVLQNGSSEKQPNPIQRNNDEAGLTKKDDSAQRNMSEMSSPSPPPPTPIAAEDRRSEKPEKKAPVPSSPNPTACPSVAANGYAHENRSSQRYDPNQSNGDVSRQKSSKDVLNSASSDEIKPRRGPIPPPPPPPAPPREDFSAPKKPLENGLSYRSESRSIIRDASSNRSEATSRSRDSSLSRHNSGDIQADSSLPKQITRDTYASDPLPPPPPPPPFLNEEHDDEKFTFNPDEVDQKADEFIARFHQQIRLDKMHSYQERLDHGQKLGLKNDLNQ